MPLIKRQRSFNMPGETTNINIRMDKALKEQAESLLSELGMNMTTAFNIFLRQAVRQRKIPFEISLNRAEVAPNMEARKELREAFKSIQEDSIRNGTDKMTMEEIDAEIAAYRREKRESAAR
jgi:DNA-damage-inducible protein J